MGYQGAGSGREEQEPLVDPLPRDLRVGIRLRFHRLYFQKRKFDLQKEKHKERTRKINNNKELICIARGVKFKGLF